VKGEVEEVWEALQVVAGGELRDHAPELLMEVDLRVDHVGQNATPAGDHSDRSLVTAGLDGQRQCWVRRFTD
jgi:hypothetical protein